MGMMKHVGMAILEDLFESGPSTRMEVWDRIEESLPSLKWEQFKRFMSHMRSTGMIVTLPISEDHPHTRIDLSAEGRTLMQPSDM